MFKPLLILVLLFAAKVACGIEHHKQHDKSTLLALSAVDVHSNLSLDIDDHDVDVELYSALASCARHAEPITNTLISFASARISKPVSIRAPPSYFY